MTVVYPMKLKDEIMPLIELKSKEEHTNNDLHEIAKSKSLKLSATREQRQRSKECMRGLRALTALNLLDKLFDERRINKRYG